MPSKPTKKTTKKSTTKTTKKPVRGTSCRTNQARAAATA